MLYLSLRLNGTRYALDAGRVTKVLPLLTINKVVGVPRFVAGTINYCGTFSPVIDLSEMLLGRAAPVKLSTRIIMVRHSSEGEPARHLGIIAENATETMRCEASAFSSPSVSDREISYFGSIADGPSGPVQLLDIERLISTVFDQLSPSEYA